MTNINSKDLQNDPNYDPLSDPNNALYDGGMTLDDSAGYENDLGEGQASAGPATPDEMRSYLRELLDQHQISQADYDKYLGKVNQAVSFPPEKQAQVFSSLRSELGQHLSSGEAGDTFADVTSKQITDLMNEIKSGQVKPIDDQYSMEQCVSVLRQALQDENSNNGTRAAEEFKQIVDAVGGPEAIDPTNLAAEKLGGSPTSIDKDGTVHFDGHANGASAELNLNAPGDGSKVIIDNATNITLTPKNNSDEVTLSEEGDYYVVQMGQDTFKVNKDAKLNILSDHVSGSVSNDDGNITIGASKDTSSKYMDPAKLAEYADKLASAAKGIEQNQPLKWDVDNKEAVKLLKGLSAAMAETDPKKRKEAWESFADALGQLTTGSDYSSSHTAGYANDVAQLVFNVLYDKLGEEGFKDALKQGIIPTDIAASLATQLTVKSDENTTDDWKNAGGGGPGWTHQTSADFLDKYASVPTAPAPSSGS